MQRIRNFEMLAVNYGILVLVLLEPRTWRMEDRTSTHFEEVLRRLADEVSSKRTAKLKVSASSELAAPSIA